MNKKNKPQKEEKISTEELTNLLKRTQANFENYRKQTEKRIDEIRDLAGKKILADLLPILDNFNLALKNKEANQEFVQGMELIHNQFNNLLNEKGVEIIKTKGKFDPYFHEALMKVESELPESTIIEEFQRGYILNGKVLRHARVKISAGKKQDTNKEENKND